ncbi:MAG: hypothetical protein ACI8WB_003303 [Phenylobacterium sp.]|jgi:hypothetical protein
MLLKKYRLTVGWVEPKAKPIIIEPKTVILYYYHAQMMGFTPFYTILRRFNQQSAAPINHPALPTT